MKIQIEKQLKKNNWKYDLLHNEWNTLEKHIETNSSVLINTVSKDINKTVNGLSNFLIVINSIIIAVSIFVGLLVVNAKIAIVLGVIFISSYLLIGIKNRIQIEEKKDCLKFFPNWKK